MITRTATNCRVKHMTSQPLAKDVVLYNAAKRPRICTHGVPSPVALTIHYCISQRLSWLIRPNQKYTTTSRVGLISAYAGDYKVYLSPSTERRRSYLQCAKALFSQCPPKHLPLWRVVCQELCAFGQRKLTTITTGHSGSFTAPTPVAPACRPSTRKLRISNTQSLATAGPNQHRDKSLKPTYKNVSQSFSFHRNNLSTISQAEITSTSATYRST